MSCLIDFDSVPQTARVFRPCSNGSPFKVPAGPTHPTGCHGRSVPGRHVVQVGVAQGVLLQHVGRVLQRQHGLKEAREDAGAVAQVGTHLQNHLLVTEVVMDDRENWLKSDEDSSSRSKERKGRGRRGRRVIVVAIGVAITNWHLYLRPHLYTTTSITMPDSNGRKASLVLRVVAEHLLGRLG